MKAIYIYPEDINSYQFNDDWAKFASKFGYDIKEPPPCILLAEIKTN